MATFNGKRYSNREFLAMLAAKDQARKAAFLQRFTQSPKTPPTAIEAKLDKLISLLEGQQQTKGQNDNG